MTWDMLTVIGTIAFSISGAIVAMEEDLDIFGVLFLGFVYLSNDLDDRYLIKRDFDVKIFDSGFTIFQSHSTDREKYQTEIKNWNGKYY